MLNLCNNIYISLINCSPLSTEKGAIVKTYAKFEAYKSLDELLELYGLNIQNFLISLFSETKHKVIYVEKDAFVKIVKVWYSMLFRSDSLTDFFKFLEVYACDLRLKANRFDYSDKEYFAMRSIDFRTDQEEGLIEKPQVRISPEGLCFEVLLFNALRTNRDDIWKVTLRKIEELTWKKLIYDWLILKNQILNAFSNDLAQLLPQRYDFPEDPSLRLKYLKEHNYFKWIFDTNFNPENWEYVRQNYDPFIYADLYSSWIRYRKIQPLDETNTKYMKLKDIISKMLSNKWLDLLLEDLKDNWVSVYIESSDYKLHNLCMVGKIYDSYNRNNLKSMDYLLISDQVKA